MNVLKGFNRRWVRQGCCRCLGLRNSSYMSSSVDMAYYSYEKIVEGALFTHPMVILHGMLGNKTNWQSLAKLFGKDGRKVVAVDARNHGESVHVGDMNYLLFRDDVLRLMDQQQIDQAVIVGHSMGGKTAMTTALTYPDRVAGLIVVDIAPTMSPSVHRHPAYLEAMLRIPLMTMADQHDQSLASIRKHIMHELSAAIEDETMRHFLASNLIIKDDKLQWKCNLDAIINNFAEIASFPKIDSETEYYGRTLFVGGSRSEYITLEHYPLIKKLFPEAEIQHVQGAGHWVHSEKPQLFIKIASDFLADAGL